MADQSAQVVRRSRERPSIPSLASTIRGAAKDLYWGIRGRWLAPPPLSSAPRSLLFVCKGNICRSPFAAQLAAQLLQQRGILDVRCLSAGFAASPEARSPLEAIEAAAAYDVSLAEHHPAPLTTSLIEESDVIIVMEVAHVELFRRLFPLFRQRILLLPLMASNWLRKGGYARYNVADPFGKSPAAFDDCYAAVAGQVAGLIEHLSSRRTA